MSGSSSTVTQHRVWASSGPTYNSLPTGYRPILVLSEANIRTLWEKANTNAQAALGIATLMTRVPIGLGVAHQLTAALTLCLAVAFAWRIRRN